MRIIGHGGGGGGGQSQHTPVESPDSLHSQATAKIVDVICEGPIGGLVNGLKSVYLNGTPVQGPDVDGEKSYNFKNLAIYDRLGTQNQTYIPGVPSDPMPTGVEH